MRSHRNKIGITACALVFLAMALSVVFPVGCSFDDTGVVFGNGSIFVMELAGSPRSEGLGKDLIWLGLRTWRPTMNSGVPSLAGSSYLIVPWPLFVLIFGTMLHILWRKEQQRQDESRLCEQCGYNLIGNISGICSECGTTVD